MDSSVRLVTKLRNIVVNNLLLILIIVGVVCGFIIGLPLNSHVQSSRYDFEERKKIVILVGFVGEIFVRLLKLLIIPLIITSIVLAVASLDTATTGKLGRRTVIYYLGTTFIAAIIGVILVLSIRPGDTAVQHEKSQPRHVNAMDSILDLIRNLFPDNLVETTFRTSETTYKDHVNSLYNTTIPVRDIRGSPGNLSKFLENNLYDPWSVNETSTSVRIIKKNSKKVWAKIEKTDRMNVLGMITCSIAFGIALSNLGPEGRPVKELLDVCLKIVMMLINAVMWTSPFGICSLIAGKLVDMEDIGKTFESLAYLIVTTITGIAIQALIVYPAIYFIFIRKNPFRYLFNMQAAAYTAFGTSSSLTSAAASIGAAAIPSAGLVTLIMVLEAAGLPTTDVGLLYSIDWFLDRFRTACNVTGDAVGCAVIEKFSHADFLDNSANVAYTNPSATEAIL
ncbi:excitatory amino acid transporter-like isoform X2 [Xenia sp. Carnegie-2017]|uniref:excitatory amino acid transporter-like isoform X2 n=1 Tax=Xenia sp. Carnegie-2017 TaxID=2897299 RepID=UPI001F036BF5|nr:excitatory amino acid transporter-like isoform X2 [Xenia sp. Carnegie-2017]